MERKSNLYCRPEKEDTITFLCSRRIYKGILNAVEFGPGVVEDADDPDQVKLTMGLDDGIHFRNTYGRFARDELTVFFRTVWNPFCPEIIFPTVLVEPDAMVKA